MAIFVPRGLRVNNPFNIRISEIPWVDKITPSADPDFEQFATPGGGIHAGLEILCNYYRHDGCTTVAQIINRWAPPSDDNPTAAYAAFVAKYCGVDPDDQVDVLDPQFLLKLASAIIEDEQGSSDYVSQQQIMSQINIILPGPVS
jgi:hypothetical protein